MIIGTGIDLLKISRIKKVLDKFGDNFLKKIFSEYELKKNKKDFLKISKLAKSFATKEAFVKALGTGFREIYPRDISIIKNTLGKPSIQCDLIRDYKAHLSVTNDRKYTLSMVVLEK